MKTFSRGESGQTIIFMTLCMTTLLGTVAMAVDFGQFFRTQRKLQAAADSAAVAGALNYLYHQSASTAQTAGAAAAQTDGYGSGTSGTAATDGSNATINVPPTSGPVTSTGYVEAIVTMPNPTAFLRYFGYSSVNVQARAVAGTPTTGGACIWAMATSGAAMNLKGSATINAPDCGIYVNSPSSNSLNITGNKACANVTFVDVVGGGGGNKQTLCQGSYTPNYGSSPRSSPWGNLGNPTCSVTYSGAISITSGKSGNQATYQATSSAPVVCFSGAVTVGSGVTLAGLTSGSDAVYVFENGVSIGTNVTIGTGSYTGSGDTTVFTSTSGATLDVASGAISGVTNLSIYAPTYGSYDGIAIMVPQTNTYYNYPTGSANELTIQTGSSSSQAVDGYIFAPYSEVYFQDSGSGVTADGLVAWLYDMNSGNKGFNVPQSYDAANASTTLNKPVTLVE